MGNVRLSYSYLDKSGDIDKETEIIEENNYYPFGLKHRGYNEIVNAETEHKFRFNDTEFDADFDLNWYNMPLRHQDPTTGRWNGIDPVTHFSSSTYAGYNNNPVFWADPSGAWGDPVNGLSSSQGSPASSGGGGGILGTLLNIGVNLALNGLQNAIKKKEFSISQKEGKYDWITFEDNGYAEAVGKTDGAWKKRVIEELDYLTSVFEGETYFNQLKLSGFPFTIKYTDDFNYAEPTDIVGAKNSNKGSGGIIHWNPEYLERGAEDELGFFEVDESITLAHELLGHGIQFICGSMDASRVFDGLGGEGIYQEVDASHRENIMRAALGIALRKFYSYPYKNPKYNSQIPESKSNPKKLYLLINLLDGNAISVFKNYNYKKSHSPKIKK